MHVTGLHLLLTYTCNYRCDHCFVWGSPRQSGTMSLDFIRTIIDQAGDAGGVEWIYFEGGEPFLFYPILLAAVREAAGRGHRTGIVSNAYWATNEEDALRCLRPLAGLVQDLSISTDSFHGGEDSCRHAQQALEAAGKLGIPAELIQIAPPEKTHVATAMGQIPAGESAVVFRGRAAEKLATRAEQHFWTSFDKCPFEDLKSPERVHLDPLGNVHVCQGISIGNLNEKPLKAIFAAYDPDRHPVVGPLLAGGPAELARHYALGGLGTYADACHLCYRVRERVRHRQAAVLTPGAMYGEYSSN